MSNVTEILFYFEKELKSILNQKDKVLSEMREFDEEFLKSSRKSSIEIAMVRKFIEQNTELQTRINMTIASDIIANEVHEQIQSIISRY